MEPRLQHRVQRYGWDRAASYYEDSWQRQLAPAQDLLMSLADLRPGERVLDVACGTGLVTFRAADAIGASGSVLGSDISDEMVAQGRRIAVERGVTQATFERMVAEELTVPDGAFDAVLCGLGMMYVVDFQAGIREMFRATRPGGRAVSAVWGRRDRCGWAEIFEVVQRRVNTDVCPMFFQLGTGDVQKTLFETAGFENVRSERLSVTLDYETDDDACRAAFAGGPVAMAYSRFDDATRDSAHEEYIESIKPYHRDGKFEIPGEYVVTIGFKP